MIGPEGSFRGPDRGGSAPTQSSGPAPTPIGLTPSPGITRGHGDPPPPPSFTPPAFNPPVNGATPPATETSQQAYSSYLGAQAGGPSSYPQYGTAQAAQPTAAAPQPQMQASQAPAFSSPTPQMSGNPWAMSMQPTAAAPVNENPTEGQTQSPWGFATTY